MITDGNAVFHLSTASSSYLFRVSKFGHLEHIHYGELLTDPAIEPLQVKHTSVIGSTVVYNSADELYSLDTMTLEWSGVGKGDYRQSPIEIKMPDGTFVCDFIYQAHRIFDGPAPMAELPTATGGEQDCQTLEISLRDAVGQVELILFYTVFPACNIITRRAVLVNHHQKPLVIRRLMSLMLDLPNRNFSLLSLHGGWIKEAHRQDQPLTCGLFVRQSTTGTSSNRHNPGFMLAEQGAGESHGRIYGFNLVYSGNHYQSTELDDQSLVRVMTGINPHCFEWTLGQGERFETPEAIMTFSEAGYNGASQNFHDFISRHIVRGDWQNRERPVLLNSWEACFFDYSRGRLMRLARQARRLGIEMFVLDDGWFGRRDNDKAGLGDYSVNRRKVGGSLASLAGAVNRLGMAFGLWFEPEMVNPDSNLYRAHPEFAVQVPGRQPALGRNQLVLDLCNPAVRDYIVAQVTGILDSAPISYVKWDMNRHISDMYSPVITHQGEFYHRYILGLYDILRRIFADRPQILLESCSSGGNRFDLGMLCFSPQIWASDNTDPIERLDIQKGLSYFYPPSTVGAHVSSAPHQQTLRQTPLPTRFNVASFGCLGYEMDLGHLLPAEKREIRAQIAFYKKHRRTLQLGRFCRFDALKSNKVHFQTIARDGQEAVAGFFQTCAKASEGFDLLPLTGLDPTAEYEVKTRPQPLALKRFGGLVNHILPVRIHPEGWLLHWLGKLITLPDCVESYTARGDVLQAGLQLNTAFVGSHYNANTRLLGDFGSNLYLINKVKGTFGA